MAFLSSLTNLVKGFNQYHTDAAKRLVGALIPPKPAGPMTTEEANKQFSISRPQNLQTQGFQINSPVANTQGQALNRAYGPTQPTVPTPTIQQVRAPQIQQSFGQTNTKSTTPLTPSIANPAQIEALNRMTMSSPSVSAPASGLSDFTSYDPTVQNRLAEMQAQVLANSSQAGTGVGAMPATTGMPLPASPATMPAQTGLSDLEKAYLASFDKTQAETEAQQRLNDIIAQQANLAASEQLGLNKIKDQAIASPFITGQSASLQRTAAGQMGALEAQSTPLVNQLAAAQQLRQAQVDRVKAEMEITGARESAMQPTTTEIGGALVQYNPATGQYTEVYRSPSEQAKPIALGEGQILVDPITGQRIASGLPKTTTPTLPKVEMFNGEPYQQDPMTGAWSRVDLGNIPNAAKVETAQNVVELAQSILDDGQFDAVFGPISSRIPTLRGDTATLEANVERLKSLLTIENMGIMKGVLSDSDMRVLSSAAAALNTGMGQAGARIEIQRIITDMQDRISKANQSSGVTSDPLGLGFKTASGQALNSPVGKLSEKYESGGNPGAVGYDNTGGYSYGTYQLAHNNAKSFINQSPYKGQFAGLAFNSPNWINKWREVAQKDPQGFANAQKNYIQQTHYLPQVKKIEQTTGVRIDQLAPVLKDVIWSTAVQHGANTDIIVRAMRQADPLLNPQGFINAVYNLRWSGGSGFSSSTPQVQQSVYNRFFGSDGERNLALSMLNQS